MFVMGLFATMVTHRLISPEDIRRMRKMRGLTQKELAKRAGVSQSLIARIERRTVDPRLSTLRKIVDALLAEREGVVVEDIMSSPVITVDANESIREVVKLMQRKGISQLPVLRRGKVVGSIQESTILEHLALTREPEVVFNTPVGRIMEEPFPIVRGNSRIEEVIDLLFKGHPAVVIYNGGGLAGIVTKIDAISSAIRLEKGEETI